MFLITLTSSALAWLGRQGTRAIAAIVFIAIALPPLDALFKPFVTEAIFAKEFDGRRSRRTSPSCQRLKTRCWRSAEDIRSSKPLASLAAFREEEIGDSVRS